MLYEGIWSDRRNLRRGVSMDRKIIKKFLYESVVMIINFRYKIWFDVVIFNDFIAARFLLYLSNSLRPIIKSHY